MKKISSLNSTPFERQLLEVEACDSSFKRYFHSPFQNAVFLKFIAEIKNKTKYLNIY